MTLAPSGARGGRRLVGALLAAALPLSAQARTIAVDAFGDDLDQGPNGNCTLREAIVAANDDVQVDGCVAGDGADVVLLPAGTYALAIPGHAEDAGLTGDLDVTADLQLAGAGATATLIDGGGATGVADRVLHAVGDVALTLQDLSITGGSGPTFRYGEDEGSGLRGDGATLDLTRVIVTRNDDPERARDGIYCKGGSLVGRELVITLNSVRDHAGLGLRARDGCSVELTDATVTANRAGGIGADAGLVIEGGVVSGNLVGEDSGGQGIEAGGAPVELRDLVVSDNEGGGVRISNGVAVLERVVIAGNGAVGRGGGLSVTGPRAATVRDSVIRDNVAGGSGGGILAGTRDELFTISSTSITGNHTDRYGGGVYTGDLVALENVTISGNSAGINSGGIANHTGSSLLVRHSTIVDNVATGGETIGHSGDALVLESSILEGACGVGTGKAITSNGGNLESPGDGCGLDRFSDHAGVPDLGLGVLADNGGLSPTHALLDGSPAIGHGIADTCPPRDQRDVARPQAVRCDAGAFERICDGPDGDGDGVPDVCDRCPADPDPAQLDTDFDGLGDACDPCTDTDRDGYGIAGANACPEGTPVDCDDLDSSVNPGMVEIPGNGVDDDCDPATPRGCEPEVAGAAVAGDPPARAGGLPVLEVALLLAAFAARGRRRRVRASFRRAAGGALTVPSWLVGGATALVAMSVAGIARAGDDFQVNQTTAGNQRDGAAAALADDSFLLSWSGPGNGGVSDVDIWGRLYSSDGSPLAGEFIITEPGDTDRRSPAAAAAAPDSFVVTWSAGSPQDIRARRVSTSGARLGTEATVNSYVTGRQANSSVAALGASGFVVAWESAGSLGDDTDNTSVQLRRLDGTGTPLAVELQVNQYTTSAQLSAAVASEANGGFVVTWQSYGSAGSDDSSASIQSRRFDSLGDPIGGELQVNQYTTGIQSSPHLTSLDDGRYLVVWRGTAAGAGFQVFARPLDSTGQPTGDEFRVSTTNVGDGNSRASPTLSRSTDDGGLVAVWRTGVPDGDGSERAIAGRFLEADGTPVGADFVVNSYTTGSVTMPDVAHTGANGWVAIWTAEDESPGDDTDPTSVVARLFGGSAIFADDFESGDSCGWAVQAPPAACPG